MSNEYLNRAEAAKAIGKSEPTLDAYLKAGKFPNAKKAKEGKRLVWKIPLSDLSHYLDKVSSPEVTARPGALTGQLLTHQEQLDAIKELEALRAENAQLKERIADAERARSDLIRAYTPQIETAAKQAQRRRWFTRSNG